MMHRGGGGGPQSGGGASSAGGRHLSSAAVRTLVLIAIGFTLGVIQTLAYCRFFPSDQAALKQALHLQKDHEATIQRLEKQLAAPQSPGSVVQRVVEVPVEVPCPQHQNQDRRHEHPEVVLDGEVEETPAPTKANHHAVVPKAKKTQPPPPVETPEPEAETEEPQPPPETPRPHPPKKKKAVSLATAKPTAAVAAKTPAPPVFTTHRAIDQLSEASFKLYPGTLEEQDQPASAAKVVEYVKSRAWNNTIMLIPVNMGYVDFGLNLMCSLLNLTGTTLLSNDTQHRGFVFIAMDSDAHKVLSDMRLPVVKDPDIPFVSSKSAAWGDPKFHQLVCTKLIVVVRMLRAGLKVILSDADIVFIKDPAIFMREDVSVTFSIGSCHKDIEDNFRLGDGAIEKLNTGFYYAHPDPGLVAMMSKALDTCRSSHLTGDQPAINGAIVADWSAGKLGKEAWQKKKAEGRREPGDDEKGGAMLLSEQHNVAAAYTYGFFDGCLFANGCVYFKHLCANSSYSQKQVRAVNRPGTATISGGLPDYTEELLRLYPRNEPVMVHANFLVGKKEKVRHLRKYGLWDDMCIAFARGGAADPTAAPTTAVPPVAPLKRKQQQRTAAPRTPQPPAVVVEQEEQEQPQQPQQPHQQLHQEHHWAEEDDGATPAPRVRRQQHQQQQAHGRHAKQQANRPRSGDE